jgi:hypothetical protein
MLLTTERAVLLLTDLQDRLMPAIYDGEVVVARAASASRDQRDRRGRGCEAHVCVLQTVLGLRHPKFREVQNLLR